MFWSLIASECRHRSRLFRRTWYYRLQATGILLPGTVSSEKCEDLCDRTVPQDRTGVPAGTVPDGARGTGHGTHACMTDTPHFHTRHSATQCRSDVLGVVYLYYASPSHVGTSFRDNCHTSSQFMYIDHHTCQFTQHDSTFILRSGSLPTSCRKRNWLECFRRAITRLSSTPILESASSTTNRRICMPSSQRRNIWNELMPRMM